MIRQFLAVLIGIVACGFVVGMVETVNLHWFPAPAGMDFHDPVQVAAHVSTLPTAAFVTVLFAWALGSLVGGAAAARVSRVWPRTCALFVAAFMLAGIVYNVVMLPHPLWMSVLGLLLPIPAALLGARLGAGRTT